MLISVNKTPDFKSFLAFEFEQHSNTIYVIHYRQTDKPSLFNCDWLHFK